MPFTKVKSSPTFVTEFKNFIDYLIEKENLRYIGGGIESIDEIIMNNAERYYDLSEKLIEKIEKMTKGGMFGSKRTEKKELSGIQDRIQPWLIYVYNCVIRGK